MSEVFPIFPRPLQPAGTEPRPPSGPAARPAATTSFEEELAGRLRSEGVRFSRHAQERLASRGISLGPGDLARVEQAVALAGAKGGRDSLVLLDGTALVVSVRSQTVVTVVDRASLKGNVFTNIDSAIIA